MAWPWMTEAHQVFAAQFRLDPRHQIWMAINPAGELLDNLFSGAIPANLKWIAEWRGPADIDAPPGDAILVFVKNSWQNRNHEPRTRQ